MIPLLAFLYLAGALMAFWWLDEPLTFRGAALVLAWWWIIPLLVCAAWAVVQIHNAFVWGRERW